MNYTKIYNNLINRAKDRLLEGYVEKHHIVPKCIGGADTRDNLVQLTAREHFIAHYLLAKMYPDTGLPHALWRMANNGRSVCSKTYEIARKLHAKRISEDTEANMRRGSPGQANGMYGKTHSASAIARIKEANNIKVECPHCGLNGTNSIMKRWHFDNCKLSPNYVAPPKMKRRKATEETKQKISNAHKGKDSPLKGRPQKKDTTCPHCGIVGGNAQLSRWHFDNCKKNPSKI